MGAKTSAEMRQAMKLIEGGLTPYKAAEKVGIARSTISRSPLFKEWKAAKELKGRKK